MQETFYKKYIVGPWASLEKGQDFFVQYDWLKNALTYKKWFVGTNKGTGLFTLKVTDIMAGCHLPKLCLKQEE